MYLDILTRSRTAGFLTFELACPSKLWFLDISSTLAELPYQDTPLALSGVLDVHLALNYSNPCLSLLSLERLCTTKTSYTIVQGLGSLYFLTHAYVNWLVQKLVT